MLLPKNHDKLQVISGVVQFQLGRHEEQGGKYYDEKAGKIAGDAIADCMPELVDMRNQRIAVGAFRAICLEDGEAPTFDGVHVEAVFRRVAIQQFISSIETGTDVPLQLSGFDLCAIMTPVYRDPDPKDIVFGKELIVPFAAITEFEKAS